MHSCKFYFAACRCGRCDYTLELPLGYDYSEGLLNLGSVKSNILWRIFCLVFLGADDFFNKLIYFWNHLFYVSLTSGWSCTCMWLHCCHKTLWTYTPHSFSSSWACSSGWNSTGNFDNLSACVCVCVYTYMHGNTDWFGSGCYDSKCFQMFL